MSHHDSIKPRIVDKPWGYELIWAETDLYIGKILHVKKNESLSLQYHPIKDETIMVLSGIVAVDFFEEGDALKTIILHEKQSFRIKPRLRHRIKGVEDSDVLEVSSPEIDDLVRLEDVYGRVES